MALKDVLSTINNDVQDIVRMGFEITNTQSDLVPNDDDPGLTFESGRTKKAKLLKTCVLFADIRSSTTLSQTHSKEVMARLYTCFVRGISQVAQHHGGIVRNIIGDRVMVVFPNKNCFTNAINTAISINTICSRVINKHFKGFDFKAGIGIDYGEMKVIKTGIAKTGKERASHKNLVWIGNTANVASKLTDIANKEISKTVYRVTRHPKNPRAWRNKGSSGLFNPVGSLFLSLYPTNWERVPGEPEYLTSTEVVDLTIEEFADSLIQYKDGSLSTWNGKMLSYEKKELKVETPPMLMTQKVWQEYAKANPGSNGVKNKWWTKQDIPVKEYQGDIIGGDVYWTDIDAIVK